MRLDVIVFLCLLPAALAWTVFFILKLRKWLIKQKKKSWQDDYECGGSDDDTDVVAPDRGDTRSSFRASYESEAKYCSLLEPT